MIWSNSENNGLLLLEMVTLFCTGICFKCDVWLSLWLLRWCHSTKRLQHHCWNLCLYFLAGEWNKDTALTSIMGWKEAWSWHWRILHCSDPLSFTHRGTIALTHLAATYFLVMYWQTWHFSITEPQPNLTLKSTGRIYQIIPCDYYCVLRVKVILSVMFLQLPTLFIPVPPRHTCIFC